MNDIERLNKFDYGLARWYAIGYRQGYDEGFENCPSGPRTTEAERVAYKRGYEAGVADYSQEFDNERLGEPR